MDDGTRWINRAARRSSPIRPSSDDEVKPLFNLRKFTIPLGDSSEKFSRKSSAGDSPRPGRDVHAPAAYRAI
ncbi:hypothetical protein DPMN_018355 [Dreissena polymorpha]|uniref:Uncharacterized protein n=1 Tax=Dreissena polymorpha TaxID=45954 RepID=A0A9D4ND20_DREPO|nr:hypothetical protein DPMN_018355 [Dreissena polymorpha]